MEDQRSLVEASLRAERSPDVYPLHPECPDVVQERLFELPVVVPVPDPPTAA